MFPVHTRRSKPSLSLDVRVNPDGQDRKTLSLVWSQPLISPPGASVSAYGSIRSLPDEALAKSGPACKFDELSSARALVVFGGMKLDSFPLEGQRSAARTNGIYVVDGAVSASTGQTDGRPLNIREMMNRTRKSTNRTWAIHAEVPAIPVKPKNPAIMAMIRKTTA